MKTKLNPWIWLFILIGFTVMLLELVITERILFFLHPRMVKFVYFAITVLVILLIDQIKLLYFNHKNLRKESIKWSFLIYLIPLFLALFRPTYLSGAILENKHISLGERPMVENQEPQIDINSDQKITPDIYEDGFLEIIEDLQENLNSRIGSEVELVGFVFRTSTFSENQFVVSRLLITCCTADAGVAGILVEGENLDIFPNDSWVKVIGKVEKHFYSDPQANLEFEIPKLVVISIEEIEPLSTPYIFP